MNCKKRKICLIVSIIAIILILAIIIYSIINSLQTSTQCMCSRMVPNYLLWVAIIIVIVAVFPISYYFTSKKLEEKMEKNLNTVSKLVDNKIKTDLKKEDLKIEDKNSILKFLNQNEKIVIKSLIKEKGEILQSDINKEEGMNKLKTHRAVKELHKKGIIIIQSYGKTNRILLSPDFKEIILR